MKQKHLLALLQSGYTTIQVKFKGTPGRTYTYKAKGNMEPGDFVVVDSPSQGLTVVEVVSVDKAPRIDIDANFTYKWIVQKVDRAEYDRTIENEAKFMDTLQEIERVRQRELLLKSFQEHLPAGTEARVIFDNAVKQLIEEK